MKKICLLLLLSCISTVSLADTLEEALVKTYRTNPKLKSSRKESMATDELVPQALSGWRPVISAGGSVAYKDTNTNPDAAIDGENTAKSWDVSISQPVYKGGATVSSTKSAESNVRASHQNLRSIENEVLLSAVEAYVNVIRDQAIFSLNKKNEKVLAKNLEASQARFDVGELTKTDVSQSEASLSNAIAEVVTARGDLNSSIANYQSIIGDYPNNLVNPTDKLKLPRNQDELLNLVLRNNPEVVTAMYLDEAAKADVDTAFADILPEVDVVGQFEKTYDPLDNVDDVRNSTVSANLVVPLYKSGSARSKIRQAKHTASQRRMEVVNTKRDIEAETISAWEAYETAKSNIGAREDQIKANEIALRGVEQEELVGARTILDVLDAEQELLDSKVELVKANRDEIFRSYELLSKTGELTAKDLKLPVDYWDVKDNYRKVRNKWWGTGVE